MNSGSGDQKNGSSIGWECFWAIFHVCLPTLKLGWRTRDMREVVGQLTRTFAALLFSRIWVPVGNTGRANVSPFAPMPLPEDLARVLYKESHHQAER